MVAVVLLLSLAATLSFADEERRYSFIKALFNDQSYVLAIQEADYFLGEYPSGRHASRVLFVKGESEFKTKNFSGAVLTFGRFIKRYPDSDYFDDAILRAGQSYYYLAGYDSAISLLKRMPVGPLYYDGQYLVGESHYRKGGYRAAITFYQTVLDSSGKAEHKPIALYSLGFCYQKLNDYARAIVLFDSLVNSYPTHDLARDGALAKGNCLLGLGRSDEAIKYLENVSEQNEPIAAQAKILIAEIHLQKKEYERARIQYERIVRYYPESEYVDDGRYGMGLSYFYEGNYVRAADAFENLLKIHPKSNLLNKGAYYLGLSYAGNREFLRARELLGSVEGDLKGDARYQVALTYFKEKNSEMCQKTIVEELRQNWPEPIKEDFRILLGESYYVTGNYKAAIEQYVKVKRPDVILRAGIVSFKIKDYQRASDLFQEAQTGLPDSLTSEALFYLGESFYRLGNYDKAKNAYSAVIGKAQTNSRKAEAYYGLGWVAFQQGRYLEAIKHFKGLAAEFPGSSLVAEALVKTGDCYFNIKSNEEAVNYYEEVIKSHAGSGQLGHAYLKAGNGFYRLGRFDQARDYYLKAKADTAFADEATYMSGFSLFRKGNYEDALKEFSRIRETSPKYWSARYASADAYYNLGKYSEAKWVYKTIIIDGDTLLFSSAADGLVWTYEKMNQTDEAIRELEALAGQVGESARKAGVLLKKGNLLYNKQRYNEAAIEYGRVINGYPGTPQVSEAIYWSGWAWYQSKDYGKARQCFVDLVDAYRDHKFSREANFMIGKISYEMKEYQAAIDHLAKIKGDTTKGYQDVLYFYLGRAYYEKGEAARAVELWALAVKEYPTNDGGTRSALEIGKIQLKEKKYDEALATLKSVIMKREDEVAAEAQFNIGEVDFAKGDLKNAALEYMRLTYVYGKFTDWSVKGQLGAARAYKEMGENGQAKSLLEKIINKYPDSLYAKEARDLLSSLPK